CLLGPSGCGKTTVLRIAAGLEPVQQGQVTLDGRVVADPRLAVPIEERGIGMVFQDYALFPHLSVADNVAFGLRRLSGEARRARVKEVLGQVGMADSAAAYPHTLSGGQQQRVALARALAPRPRVMLLDEPFSGLDTRLRDQVRDQTLHVLKECGAATLMVTHDPEEAMFMADRVALMRGGRLVQVGRPTELYCAPADAFVASFFGEINQFAGTIAHGRVATPFGDLAAHGLPDGTAVEILIRPEALRLTAMTPAMAVGEGGAARVMAARMLGRSSLVHLSVDGAKGEALHLHARVPGRYLPKQDEVLAVHLDHSQTFVFPRAAGR
ncbi:MAG: ABC transporter ATP-binding protein, partial [Kiloniellales bacterium]|nr:ABC transporter ATP-binding protein [Kiloniellales bacterium]